MIKLEWHKGADSALPERSYRLHDVTQNLQCKNIKRLIDYRYDSTSYS